MIPFFLDSETRSSIRLELGLDQYMQGVEPLIWTFCAEKGPVDAWDMTDGTAMPNKLEDAILDERVTLVAHNVPFDRNALRYGHGMEPPLERWWCTMSQAYAHGLPGSLEALGPVLGLPLEMQKLIIGKKLIDLFCIPKKGKPWNDKHTHPVEWAQFIDYAVGDTGALREVFNRLPRHNYDEAGRALWVLDQEINERGFRIDQDLCRAALVIRDNMKLHLNGEVEELTRGADPSFGEITKGTQREKIHHYLVGECGLLLLDLTKDTIKKTLEDKTLDPDTRRLLELRRDSSLTSLTKYQRALERVGPDGRMRHTLQYSGAGRTGRWAGRGVQPHNMPRPKREAEEIEGEVIPAILDGTLPQKYDDVNQACQDALRGMIVAAPGHEFVVGDWSNIEGRCVAWEAEEQWKIDAFRANDAGEGEDLYNILYAKLFNMDVSAVDGKSRQKGKAFELAFGYGGGVGACVTASATYGVDLVELSHVAIEGSTTELYNKAEKAWKRAFIRGEDHRLEPDVYIGCDIAKQMYRKANKNIAQLWWTVGRACRWAVERPGSVHFAARCKIWRNGAWLIIELPSKRRLFYADPKIKTVVEYDDETEELQKRDNVSYMAAKSKQWRRERTYGGKLVENITQAIANDVLRAAMLAAREDGWPLVLHVHDELVAEVLKALFGLDDLLQLMERPLWWANGLPLKAAGYTSLRFKKD